MKAIRTLFIQFEQELPNRLVSAFRGAIVEKVGRENILFHQHIGNGKLLYSYPLIQYKNIGRRASIMCLGEGVDEIHKLFMKPKWDIDLKEEKITLTINRLDLNTFKLNVWDKMFDYQIRNWIGLNEKNYKIYQETESLTERIALLERTLIGNIISFAKGMNWDVDKEINLNIKEIKSQKSIKFKGVPMISFDIDLKCNAFLPNYIGLGKSASHGFGTIRQMRKN